jgi:catechol 2,3-dioxygenase-like lactoylglutathione lyase family enzyme
VFNQSHEEAVVGVVGFDHVAIPSQDPEAMLAFYRDLGFHVPDESLWRGVPNPRLTIVCGDQKINLHAPSEWQDPAFTLRAQASRPGCGDFCFVWDGSVDDLLDAVRSASSSGVGGAKTRGWVTTRRKPLSTRSERPNAASPPATSSNQAA